MKTNIICAGCNVDSSELDCYDDDENPVTEDGTYYNQKFVCDNCYSKLISIGHDIGTPVELQNRARNLNGG